MSSEADPSIALPAAPPRGAARPIVAIVGRPNVGKSTLFNRLAGRRKAIVEDVPGVTRDRNYADAEWSGRPYTVVDTGGFHPETDDQMLSRVRDQARLAIDESQAVILVTDGLTGLCAADQEIASMLRRAGKPTLVAVNKMDSARREEEELFTDFHRLGIAGTFAVSAEHGRGTGDLLDALVQMLPEAPEPLEEGPGEEVCRVAIVGRPNVGKSTFLNRLLGEERSVASELPGTTTDPIDARIVHGGRTYLLTDTAGIRRKRSIAAKVEQFSVMRAIGAIDRADVVVLLLDAREPAVEQDAKIAAVAVERGKAIVLMLNKWDLVSGTLKARDLREELLRQMPFLSWAPVYFASALTGQEVFRVLEAAGELYQHTSARIPTPLLNEFLGKIIDEHPAPLAKGGYPVRLFYIAQVGERPPTFAITCNRPESVTDDYQRFIVNRMRQAFGLKVPIRLLMRRKSKKEFVARRPEHAKGGRGTRRPDRVKRRKRDR